MLHVLGGKELKVMHANKIYTDPSYSHHFLQCNNEKHLMLHQEESIQCRITNWPWQIQKFQKGGTEPGGGWSREGGWVQHVSVY